MDLNNVAYIVVIEFIEANDANTTDALSDRKCRHIL